MMLVEKLQDDLKHAMRQRDEARLRTIRSLRAAMLEREIELRKGDKESLPDEEAVSVMQKQAKQRRDAIDQYKDAGRHDLADKEQEELAIIEDYLPEQLSDDEIRKAVAEIVSATGAIGLKDMGKVMGAAMGKLKGKADGRAVQEAAKDLLSDS